MLTYIKKISSFKVRVLFFALFVSVVLNTHYYSDYQTTLLPGIYIKNGSSDLKANYWSAPLVYYWNSDGKKDLLIGNRHIDEKRRSFGYVHFYENMGTDSEPSFNGSTRIQTCTDVCSPLNVAASG